jgi:protein-S-isoprenylcysteine O-methyltransferase Ste14
VRASTGPRDLRLGANFTSRSSVSSSVVANIIAAAVAISTLIFVLSGIRKRSVHQHVTARDRWSRLGIVLQGLAFAATFMLRPPSGRVFEGWGPLHAALPWIALLLGAAAWTLLLTAQRALGRQWSVSARLVEGHRLITTGPYALVRHPIYLGLLLLLLAAGLAESTPFVLGGAAAIFLIGFVVRIRAEERLLQAAFLNEWDAYRRRVPAIIPFTAFGNR